MWAAKNKKACRQKFSFLNRYPWALAYTELEYLSSCNLGLYIILDMGLKARLMGMVGWLAWSPGLSNNNPEHTSYRSEIIGYHRVSA